jgi:hypothetical protein
MAASLTEVDEPYSVVAYRIERRCTDSEGFAISLFNASAFHSIAAITEIGADAKILKFFVFRKKAESKISSNCVTTLINDVASAAASSTFTSCGETRGKGRVD